MKKSILSLVVAVILVIMMLTSSAYAANEDVTLDKVKEALLFIVVASSKIFVTAFFLLISE